MKICAIVRGGEWSILSCLGDETVGWLAREVLRLGSKMIKSGKTDADMEKVFESEPEVTFNCQVCKVSRSGGDILDLNARIESVLKDEDLVSIEIIRMNEEEKTSSTKEQKIPRLNHVGFHENEILILDGQSLTCDDLMRLGDGTVKIKLSLDSMEKVRKARNVVEEIIKNNKVAYGINTGFGKFARTVIAKDDLEKLQDNLIRSHAAGVGEPLNPVRTRRLLALRINVLAKGYSGISLTTLQQYIDAFNASCLSWVPEKGTVGASGDLAPLAHLALGLMGEGKMWSPSTGWDEAKTVLDKNGLQPLRLGPKEGISLINGTQLISALGVEGLQRAAAACRQADIVAALTIDLLKGSTKAFDADVHLVRPHSGQIAVANRLRALLHSDAFPSQISESHRFCDRVQDPYSMRCCPQVHGIVHDTIEFVRGVLSTEINSATDNPMVFAERGEIISGGNFHGEYPSKVLDYLTIAIHEIGSISERRIERLVNPNYSELPAFLTKDGGLNSGFMMAHCTAAALVSENKVLCHPSSIDSLPTSAGTEDHVSMGGFSARKLLHVVENVEHVVAIELLAACQALEFFRPAMTTKPLECLYSLVRSVIKPRDEDRAMAPDIEASTELIKQQKVLEAVRMYLDPFEMVQDAEDALISSSSTTKTTISATTINGVNDKINAE